MADKQVAVDCHLESLAVSWDGEDKVPCRGFGLLNTEQGMPAEVVDEVASDVHNDEAEEDNSVVHDEVDMHGEEGMMLRSNVAAAAVVVQQ